MPKGKLFKRAANAAGKPSDLCFTIASGAGANTNIAITGIKCKSQLVSVIEVPASAALVDRTATTSITSDGNIQCTSSTSGNQVLVVWYA